DLVRQRLSTNSVPKSTTVIREVPVTPAESPTSWRSWIEPKPVHCAGESSQPVTQRQPNVAIIIPNNRRMLTVAVAQLYQIYRAPIRNHLRHRLRRLYM